MSLELSVRGCGKEVPYERPPRTRQTLAEHSRPGADGQLASTITRESVGTDAKPPKVGPLVWFAEWESAGKLYRAAVESHGPGGNRLWRDVATVARETNLSLDILLPAAHNAARCGWRPIPAVTIGDVLRSDVAGLKTLAEASSGAEVSRCADLVTAVAMAIDRMATAVEESGGAGDPDDKSIDFAAILDDAAPAVVTIAGDESKSLDERMRLIAIAKPEAVHWKSRRWAELLGVTAGRIRQTDTWIAWRAAEKKPDKR